MRAKRGWTWKMAAPFAVAAAALTGCYAEVGEVLTTVRCQGAGCGQQGDLHAAVTDCGDNVGVYGRYLLEDVLLLTGSAGNTTVEFQAVPQGTRCVQAFLDVDTNGELSTGDVIPAGGPVQPVEVQEDETTEVDLVLDSVLP